VGRKTTQGMPSTSSLVKPLETLQTPTTSVSLSPHLTKEDEVDGAIIKDLMLEWITTVK
jgi:hypothetical protein